MDAASTGWDRREQISFWWLAAVLVAVLAGASAPSPLYPVYQAEIGFTTLTITAIYAVFAGGGVVGLLVAGRVSDYVGRRPVVVAAMMVQLLAMGNFLVADSELVLYLARILSGLSIGIGVSALSAWLVDLQPAANPRLGGLVAGSAVMLGLGAGAFGSGLLVEFGPNPTQFVYLVLSALYVVALGGLLAVPDVSLHRAGWIRALMPQVGIPAAAREEFVASAPSLVGMWALGGLFLSLGPTLAILLLGYSNAAAGGVVIFLLLGVGAVASIVARNRAAAPLIAQGSTVLIAGVAVTLLGVFLEQTGVLFVGALIAGVGLGSAFSAVVRRLTPLAPPDRRAALMAAIFVTVYLSFSVPTVVAGLFANAVGIRTTAYAYGVIVGVLAAVTTIVVTRRTRVARADAEKVA